MCLPLLFSALPILGGAFYFAGWAVALMKGSFMHSAGITSQSSFAAVHSPSPQRSVIPVSTRRMHPFNAGELIPAYHEFCLPGDVYNLDVSMFGRLLTLKFPLMDNLILDWFVFFIPERLVWKNFEKMQGFQENPGDSTDYVFPWVYGGAESSYQVELNTPLDYLGLPVLTDIDSSVWHVRSGPLRAYYLVWNEWFRDQNYQQSLPIGSSVDPAGDGPDNVSVMNILLRRNKKPDYFSAALPDAQKGPQVPIPWQGDAPVVGNGYTIGLTLGGASTFGAAAGSFTDSQAYLFGDSDFYGSPVGTTGSASATTPGGVWSAGLTTEASASGMIADIRAVSANINQLRDSIVLQQVYELDMRGGTRYTEALKNRWDVDAQDFRLQRPEYVGGGSTDFSVSQVAQTAPTSGENAQASLAAYSELRAYGKINYTCVEHGHLLMLVNVRAPLTYQQQINRKWLAASRFDLPEPLTMNLGERPVMTSEIYFPPNNPDDVWGYQEIWAEYRYSPSFVTGQFRSIAPDSLDAWHLALDYEEAPIHNGAWVEDHPPVSRVVAFNDQPQLKLDLLVRGKVAKKMPVVSIPGLLRL